MVDEEYLVDDSFLDKYKISKGHMQLVDESRLRELVQALLRDPQARTSGGSVANSIYACRGFGCSAHLVCRVASDATGIHFKEDLDAAGIGCTPISDSADCQSGMCLVLITPDAERTLNTCLGVSHLLSVDQLDMGVLENAKCLYIEGYLASSPSGSETAVVARTVAEESGVTTSLTLSDASMIQFHKPELTRMLGEGVDRLFCNEEEALLWCGTDRIDIAMAELLDTARNVHITLSERGCLTNEGSQTRPVEGSPVEPVDVNGAGDIFAAGVLAALSHGANNLEASKFGNFVASILIQQYGARLANIEAYQDLIHNYSTFKSQKATHA